MEDEAEPRTVAPRILFAPRLGQLFWCDFWIDAQKPEMWKQRPVLVVSRNSGHSLRGSCLVLPVSTKPQGPNPWAHELSVRLKGRQNWVLCDLPSTVATSRLSMVGRGRVMVPPDELQAILRRLRDWLPRPRED